MLAVAAPNPRYAKRRCQSTRVADRAGLPVVRKDILRVGSWQLADGQKWRITPHHLARIAANFKRFTANGNRVPWIINHDGGAALRIGDVIRLSLVGGTLYADCQVTERKYQASFGKPGEVTHQEVSVEVCEPWQDGAGNIYDVCLTHLANVINPVVTHQGPFRRLLSKSPVRRMRMAEEAAADSGSAVDTTVDTVKELKLFLKGKTGEEPKGITAADDATEISVAEVAAMLLAYMGGEEEAVEPPEEPAEIPGDPAMMAQASLAEQVVALKRQLAAVQVNERDTYHSEVDLLVSANHLTPAEGKAIKSAADRAKTYQMSLLAPYRRLKSGALPTQRRAALGATGDPPDVGTKSAIPTKEAVAKVAREFWGVRGGAK